MILDVLRARHGRIGNAAAHVRVVAMRESILLTCLVYRLLEHQATATWMHCIRRPHRWIVYAFELTRHEVGTLADADSILVGLTQVLVILWLGFGDFLRRAEPTAWLALVARVLLRSDGVAVAGRPLLVRFFLDRATHRAVLIHHFIRGDGVPLRTSLRIRLRFKLGCTIDVWRPFAQPIKAVCCDRCFTANTGLYVGDTMLVDLLVAQDAVVDDVLRH